MRREFQCQAEPRDSAAEDDKIDLIHRYTTSNNIVRVSLLHIILRFLSINPCSHWHRLHTGIVNQAEEAAQRDRDPLRTIIELVPKLVERFMDQEAP